MILAPITITHTVVLIHCSQIFIADNPWPPFFAVWSAKRPKTGAHKLHKSIYICRLYQRYTPDALIEKFTIGICE